MDPLLRLAREYCVFNCVRTPHILGADAEWELRYLGTYLSRWRSSGRLSNDRWVAQARVFCKRVTSRQEANCAVQRPQALISRQNISFVEGVRGGVRLILSRFLSRCLPVMSTANCTG